MSFVPAGSLRAAVRLSLAASMIVAAASTVGTARADTFYVSNEPVAADRDGSEGRPWATIDDAIDQLPIEGGHEVIVRSGRYDGPVFIDRAFGSEVVIRAEVPYGVTLVNLTTSDAIVTVGFDAPADVQPVNVVLEGFVISNEGSDRGECSRREGHMLFVTNASSFTFANNILYGNNRFPRCNNPIKVNIVGASRQSRALRFVGNVFGNPPGSNADTDFFEIFEPGEIDIEDNIFYSAREPGDGGSFVAIRKMWGTVDRDPRFRIRRNVFLSFESNPDASFIRLGGWGYSLREGLVENNLFVGNSPHPMRAPILFEDASDLTVRANTIVGDLPSTAFGFWVGAQIADPTPSGLLAANNVFFDPEGTLGTLVAIDGSATPDSLTLHNNLVFDGSATPPGATDDALIVGDPLLPTDYSAIPPPTWAPEQLRFVSGGRTIREELVRLVRAYGMPAAGSAVVDAADPDHMPTDDILGNDRDPAPDLGAYEVDGTEPPPSVPGEPPVPPSDGDPSGDASIVAPGPDAGTGLSGDGGGCSALGTRGDGLVSFLLCFVLARLRRCRRSSTA